MVLEGLTYKLCLELIKNALLFNNVQKRTKKSNKSSFYD